MALPVAANTTCAIYRAGHAPPASPDVAAVPCHLGSSFHKRKHIGENMPWQVRFTHILTVDLNTDIRDDWQNFVTGISGSNQEDIVYIPDQNGTAFKVIFVERRGQGTPTDHKRVYLHRDNPKLWSNLY
jgi:hypothetical protein